MSEKVKLTRDSEVWKDITGYEGIYQVSDKGRVKCLEKHVVSTDKGHKRYYPERIASTHLRNGYPSVELSKNGKSKKFTVHRLVATHFLSNEGKAPQVNHIDGNKENNNVNNLEWATASENIKHSIENGLRPKYHKGLKVIQKNHEGVELNAYKSIRSASKITGINHSCIYKACKGTYKQAGGFLWELAEDRKDINGGDDE